MFSLITKHSLDVPNVILIIVILSDEIFASLGNSLDASLVGR